MKHQVRKFKWFLFANENIAQYLGAIGGVQGKNVLTVASGGDQAFECYMGGAQHVDTFDINAMQAYIMNFKFNLIKEVSYQTFMDLLMRPTDISKIKTSAMNKKLATIAKKHQWNLVSCGCRTDFLTYLASEDNYMKLRQRLPDKIEFSHNDVQVLPHVINKSYDVILLSNIEDYIPIPPEPVNLFHSDVITPLAERCLNPGGTIVCGYAWCGRGKLYDDAIEYNKIARTRNLPQRFFVAPLDTVKTHVPDYMHDAALIMQDLRTR